MPIRKRRTYRTLMITALWLSITLPGARLSFGEEKVQTIYTFSDTSIKDFQNKLLPQSVANDRRVFLGSIGSDLWHGRQDARDEFWMITDREPNGQIRVDSVNRRTFWVPEFNPMILKVKTVDKEIRILEALPIIGQSGRPVTGLPNLKGIDETPYNYTAQVLLTVSTLKAWSARAKEIFGSRKNTARRWCM